VAVALDAFDMASFPNFISIVPDVPREQFKEILENAVAFTQSADFTTNPDCGSGRFAQVAGLDFPWSASGDGQILVAISDFLATGGDQYPFRGAPFTTLGRTYQQTLQTYIEDSLGGLITASDYPAGGESRITELP
jgi:hypothetical protein